MREHAERTREQVRHGATRGEMSLVQQHKRDSGERERFEYK